MDKNLRLQFIITCGVIGFTIFVGLICFYSDFIYALEDNASSSIAVNVVSACTIDSTTTSHTVSVVNGRNTSDIGTTTFRTSCNDGSGYALYARGYSGDTAGNTNLIAGAPLGGSDDIVTGILTSGSTSNWSMKMIAGNDNTVISDAFLDYAIIPSQYTKVASKTSGTSTDHALIASSSYQIFVANTQSAGSYTGKVEYTLVHPSTACPDGLELEGGVCIVNLCGNIPKMQSITSSYISNMTTDAQVQMCDNRDGKIYWVSKLKDGNVWMTQNLDLDLSDSVTLTPSDTNITSNWTPATTTIVKTNLNSSSWAAHNDYIHPYSFDGGDAYLPNGKLTSACWNRNITACPGAGTLSLTDTATVLGNTNAHYHVGNLYTWTAAIASNDSSSYTTRYENVSSSICPKGWKLPSSYDGDSIDGDFTNLLNTYRIGIGTGSGYSDSALLAAPLYFVRSGWVGSNVLDDIGSQGNYWSSTVYSSDDAYQLYFNSISVNPTWSRVRYFGKSIRCITK